MVLSLRMSREGIHLRAITLEFLINFTSEHNVWFVPTWQVVRDIIVPSTGDQIVPYSQQIERSHVGHVDIFISHAWTNYFGLLVTAVRKYVSSIKKKVKPKFFWLDIFAITQHGGLFQQDELLQLESTVDVAQHTLVVIDDALGIPLRRIWCIFEIYVSLRGGIYGKLKVRAGHLIDKGEIQFVPCMDPTVLRALEEMIDINRAEATVELDKTAILSRVLEMSKEDRNGIDEINRKLRRAVRQGW
jgi:hypothetical protein